MVKKGDTLIEVTLAVGIFSMVAIAIVAVMSGGILVGPEIQLTQMMSPDIRISQTIGSTSPVTSRHRVTRYSNIHYSQQ